jgi:ABC-type lipoprotein release transport system permease subunit
VSGRAGEREKETFKSQISSLKFEKFSPALPLFFSRSPAPKPANSDFGIRIALGAQTGDVLRLIVKNGLVLALFGSVIGLAGAFGLTRLMKGLLFGVSATDPLTFLMITALLTLIALLACYIPARRAAKVDPIIALRTE